MPPSEADAGIFTKRGEAADYLFTILRELEKMARTNDMAMLANMLSISRDEARKFCPRP